MLERLFSFTMEITLALSLIIMALLALSRIIDRKYCARCKYFLWLILAARLAIPLNMNFPQPFLHIVAPYKFPPLEVAAEKLASTQTLPTSFFASASVIQILTAVWIIGCCCYFLYHIFQYSAFKNGIKRWGAPVADTQILHIFRSVKYDMGIYSHMNLCTSPTVKTPIIAGFLHSTVVLPECKLDSDQLAMVFRHELTHFKRKDLFYKFLLLFIGSLHWFNPLVHILIHHACKELETSCDSDVIRNRSETFIYAYAKSIMGVAKATVSLGGGAQGRTLLSASFESSRQLLQDRFSNLFADKKRDGSAFLVLMAFVVLAGSSLIWFRGNDENLDWAQNVSPSDIEAVEVITSTGRQSSTVISTKQVKNAIAGWLNKLRVEIAPAVLKKNLQKQDSYSEMQNTAHQVTYVVTQRDGSVYEITKLDSRYLSVNGKEYRNFGGRGIFVD